MTLQKKVSRVFFCVVSSVCGECERAASVVSHLVWQECSPDQQVAQTQPAHTGIFPARHFSVRPH